MDESNFSQNKAHIFIVICMNFYMNFDGMILTFYTWHGSVWYIVGIYQDKCLETIHYRHIKTWFLLISARAPSISTNLLSYPLIKLIGLCLAHSLELSANQIASQNLLRLRRKARYARLLPPETLAPSAFALDFPRAFRARYLCQLPRIESLTKTTEHQIN